MPSCEPVCQVIESGRDGENLEKLSIETTVVTVVNVYGFTGDTIFYSYTWHAHKMVTTKYKTQFHDR